ncbi:MAG: 50S ribosomal protein L16 [Candidatus Bipolaricaulota bacterium]
MALYPQNYKHRKQQRGRMKGEASRGNRVSFGEFGIQAQEPCWLTGRQIETARMTLAHETHRDSKIWVRVFPDKPITKTPAETRMGKGKGELEEWVAVVRPGRMIYEFSGVDKSRAKRLHKLVSYKLPLKTRLKERIKLGGEV